ncbi:hypothetical protein KUCAC02_033237 [Chaenocephalus aceratus]|nr:hypothetical protein KUCAC02_033237 [Chaenocephalus aceratus]
MNTEIVAVVPWDTTNLLNTNTWKYQQSN